MSRFVIPGIRFFDVAAVVADVYVNNGWSVVIDNRFDDLLVHSISIRIFVRRGRKTERILQMKVRFIAHTFVRDTIKIRHRQFFFPNRSFPGG